MFIGHFAVGFAAKRAVPAVSLGMLFFACQLADLVWPNLVLLGIERVDVDRGNTAFTPLDFVSYPYSHSLLALTGWSALVGVLYRLVRCAAKPAAVVVALIVLSHWVLDVLTHRPDMPLTIWGTARVGLGLWNSVPATIAVEGLMFVAGTVLYIRATIARDRAGSFGLWGLIAFLALINGVNIAGPLPPSSSAVAWTAQLMWLIVLWAFWVDRHRRARPDGPGS